MIRINLLGVPRPKKGRSAAMPSMAGGGPTPLVMRVIVVLIGLVANAVANLIGNLKKSGPGCSPTTPANCYFKDVEIKETFQDDSFKGMQAFQFSLICQKQDKKS